MKSFTYAEMSLLHQNRLVFNLDKVVELLGWLRGFERTKEEIINKIISMNWKA